MKTKKKKCYNYFVFYSFFHHGELKHSRIVMNFPKIKNNEDIQFLEKRIGLHLSGEMLINNVLINSISKL